MIVDNNFPTLIKIDEILSLIPHRYPFLLIDQVHMGPNFEAIGIKNVTINESFFQGHFPERPIMPGVLIIEAMAQTAAVLIAKTVGKKTGDGVYFMTIEKARFRKPIVPGNQVGLHVTKIKNRGNIWKFSGKAIVNDQLMAEAIYSAMIMES